MTDNQSSDRLPQLIDDWCDGTITSVDAAELNGRLSNDESARREFLRCTELHGLLLAGDAALSAAEQDSLPTPAPRKLPAWLGASGRFFARPRNFSLSVAALVIAAIVAVMAVIAPPFFQSVATNDEAVQPRSGAIVAQITGLHDAVWVEGQIGKRRESWLQIGHAMELKQGMAELTFGSGAVVLLEAPVQFQLTGTNAGQLSSGRLTATVPQAAHGFMIDTPVAKITDLGTEFGVSIDPYRSGIQVFQGSVEVDPKSRHVSDVGKRVLTAGQGLVFDQSGVVLQSERPDALAFRRRIPAAPQLVDATPEYVAGENFSRVLVAGVGRATQDAELHSYDAAVAGAASNQYVWLDFAAALSQLPPDRAEKVFLRWEGTILPRVAHRGGASVSADLGIFPVPDNQRGIPTIFTRGDGQDNVRFYTAHEDELVDAVTVPVVDANRRFQATWDVTVLVQDWLENPDAAHRGQLIIINGEHPIWVNWERNMPRLYAQVRPEDLRSDSTDSGEPEIPSTDSEQEME